MYPPNALFGLLGGLGLFIFGMKYLSEGLQQIATNRIRNIMKKVTNNRLSAVFLGTTVTSIVQSSSITTVILVGLINAGILSFSQSAGIVLGANIGTTITAQMIAFKISVLIYPFLALGMFLMLISKKEKIRFTGQIIFALGIIFFGLKIMSSSVKPLKDIPAIVDFFVMLSKHPILGILSGLLLTVAIQSSSASIGLLLALASTGLIDFQAALYILLGDNIGTTITAWLASIGGNVSSKRLAAFHSTFNILGSIYFAFFIYFGWYSKFIDFITPGHINTATIGRHIANAHTFFNILNTLIFLPILPILVNFIKKIIPERASEKYLALSQIKYLQDSLIDTPELAIDSAIKEIAEMAKLSKDVLTITFDGFFNKDIDSIKKVSVIESKIDKLQHDITLYLSKISNLILPRELAGTLPVLIHSINDIERISDHAVTVSKMIDRMINQNITFSDEAIQDLKKVVEILNEMETNVLELLQGINHTDGIRKMKNLELELNKLHADFLEKQTERIIDGTCTPRASLIFIDTMNNIERIGDHLTNISQAAENNFIISENSLKIELDEA